MSGGRGVTTRITGGRTNEQLRDNLGAASLSLTADERGPGQGQRPGPGLPVLAPARHGPRPPRPGRPRAARAAPSGLKTRAAATRWMNHAEPRDAGTTAGSG